MKPLVDGKVDCSHIPEAHIAWAKRGWQAEAYCKCQKIRVVGKRLHATFDGAIAASDVLLKMLKANQR